ncbi:MAG TPA: XdhC/CoxI family protein [Chloroflexota bacterium]|nr:XdhC/CoxI family protein [Chloroflexota bacterium]
MKDIAPQLRIWQQQGKRFAMATLVKVDRSAPKPPGSVMAVCEDGTVAGSVSGGCVESALHEEALGVIQSGAPKTVTYGISDTEGWNVGLACGGQLHLFVDRPELPAGLLEAIEGSEPVALATVVSGETAGRRTLIRPDDQSQTADPVGADAQILLAKQATELRSYPEGDVFIQTFAPAAEMYVFGAVDFSAAMTRMGKFLGYHVIVIDPRAVFATKERFPDADQVVVDWPDKFLARAAIGPSTAMIILTHDPKFDIPALLHALKTDAGYIGAMGAKRTNEERFRKLREAGCSEEQLARIHAPIGLDIGGKSPEETAVSIAAEIIALRNGKLQR